MHTHASINILYILCFLGSLNVIEQQDGTNWDNLINYKLLLCINGLYYLLQTVHFSCYTVSFLFVAYQGCRGGNGWQPISRQNQEVWWVGRGRSHQRWKHHHGWRTWQGAGVYHQGAVNGVSHHYHYFITDIYSNILTSISSLSSYHCYHCTIMS